MMMRMICTWRWYIFATWDWGGWKRRGSILRGRGKHTNGIGMSIDVREFVVEWIFVVRWRRCRWRREMMISSSEMMRMRINWRMPIVEDLRMRRIMLNTIVLNLRDVINVWFFVNFWFRFHNDHLWATEICNNCSILAHVKRQWSWGDNLKIRRVYIRQIAWRWRVLSTTIHFFYLFFKIFEPLSKHWSVISFKFIYFFLTIFFLNPKCKLLNTSYLFQWHSNTKSTLASIRLICSLSFLLSDDDLLSEYNVHECACVTV